MKKWQLFLAAALIAATPLVAADTYTVDKAHSEVNFRIKHLMSSVSGSFNDFSGAVVIDQKSPSVEFTINAASIDTDNEDRDKHLRSADFFDVAKHPTITFKSSRIAPTDEKDVYNVTGNFTMHGVTKQITMPVTFLGFGKDPWGNDRAGFELETKLNRKDYGITWNKALDQGGVLLGDDVRITINLEAVKKK